MQKIIVLGDYGDDHFRLLAIMEDNMETYCFRDEASYLSNVNFNTPPTFGTPIDVCIVMHAKLIT